MNEDAFFRLAGNIRLTAGESAVLARNIDAFSASHPVRAGDEACRTEHMNQQEKTLVQSARSLGLSAEESKKMQKNISAFMQEHPVRAEDDMNRKERGWTIRSLFSLYPMPALSLFIIAFLTVGATTSFAAQSALPGDFLYPVKVHVNENVQVALARSPEAKATIRADQAEERLRESEKLAALGRLNDETRTQLAAAFQAHADSARQEIAMTLPSNASATTDLDARFEGDMSAHQALLTTIAETENKTNGDGQKHAEMFVGTATKISEDSPVQPSLAAPMAMKVTMEVSQQAADAALRAATKKIQDVRAFIGKNGPAGANADLRLQTADKALLEAKAKADAGFAAEAAALARKAQKIAQEAKVLVEATQNLHLPEQMNAAVRVKMEMQDKSDNIREQETGSHPSSAAGEGNSPVESSKNAETHIEKNDDGTKIRIDQKSHVEVKQRLQITP